MTQIPPHTGSLSDEVGGVSTLTSLRILTVVSITFQCSSPATPGRQTLKRNVEIKNNLKMYLKNLIVKYRHMAVIF